MLWNMSKINKKDTRTMLIYMNIQLIDITLVSFFLFNFELFNFSYVNMSWEFCWYVLIIMQSLNIV